MLKLRLHLVWQFSFLLIVCGANLTVWPQIKDTAHLTDGHRSSADTFTATFENGPAAANQTSIKLRCQSPESAAGD
jgi:hypothetical protein